MAITLITDLSHSMFSAQVPDIEISTSSSDEMIVTLTTNSGETILNVTHTPFQGMVYVHDVRSVIENYLMGNGSQMTTVRLIVTQNSAESVLANFKVVFLQYDTDKDCATYIANNFLSVKKAKLISINATEYVYAHIPANTSVAIQVQAEVTIDGTDRSLTIDYTWGSQQADRIDGFEISCEKIMAIILGWQNPPDREDVIIHSFAVSAGNRSVTFYVSEQVPSLAFYFRNAFNVYERCELQAVTTQKALSERSGAVVNGKNMFYNIKNEKHYAVESEGLTAGKARWIEQMFYSHEVRIAKTRTDFTTQYNLQNLQLVQITDFTCEINDEDGDLNSVKFTYQYDDKRPWLQA